MEKIELTRGTIQDPPDSEVTDGYATCEFDIDTVLEFTAHIMGKGNGTVHVLHH